MDNLLGENPQDRVELVGVALSRVAQPVQIGPLAGSRTHVVSAFPALHIVCGMVFKIPLP